jgi:hypothetical protein
MAEYDAGFEIVARASGQGLTRLAGYAVDRWEPIGDTLQTTERLADRAFRAQRGERRFVVYMEAYTRWVDSAPWSVLAKSGLLSERERLPTRSLIFVLLPQGYRPQSGKFRLEAEPGDPTQQVWFREVCMWEQKPEPWWEHSPGLMALYPLCDHGQASATAVAHAAEAIRHREMDSARRTDLLTTLAIFGRLADSTLDVLSIIRREEMRDSPIIQEFIQEGEQLRARKDVLRVVELRFGAEAVKEFEEALNRIESLERLQQLLELAVRARRISQFRRAVSS